RQREEAKYETETAWLQVDAVTEGARKAQRQVRELEEGIIEGQQERKDDSAGANSTLDAAFDRLAQPSSKPPQKDREDGTKQLRDDVEMRVRELLEEAGLASPPMEVWGEHGEESWWRQGRDNTLDFVRGDLSEY